MSTAEVQNLVVSYAQRYGINPAVALAQIQQESGFNPRAYNRGTGASGLGQFIPGTWAQYGGGADPFDPAANLDAWGRYMRDLLDQFGGDYARALIGYHSGAGAVAGVLRNPAGNPRSTNYYQTILAKAGQWAALPSTATTEEAQPANLAWLPLAGAALAVILFFS